MDISKHARTFGKMDLKSSKSRMRVLFTSIKHNFFQKLHFILTKRTFGLAFFKTWFLGWKSWNKRALSKEICNSFYFIFIFSYIKWVEGGICSLVLFMGFFFLSPSKKWVERGFISRLFLWEDWAVPLSQRHVIDISHKFIFQIWILLFITNKIYIYIYTHTHTQNHIAFFFKWTKKWTHACDHWPSPLKPAIDGMKHP